jgi:virginiamycin B lyase
VRLRLAAALLVVCVLPVGSANGRVWDAAADGARCKIVKKKVHGKIRKVRVCKKQKPKPAPPIARLTATVAAGGLVYDLVSEGTSLWARVDLNNAGLGEVVERIDPATNSVTLRVNVGEGFAIAVGQGAVWAPNHDAGTLSRIDPVTGTVIATIPIPGVGPHGVATTPGAVWVGTEGPPDKPGSIVRIDPATNSVVSTIELPGAFGAQDLAAGTGAVWANAQGAVLRIDPASNQIAATIPVGQVCGGIAANDASVWSASSICNGGQGLMHIDPASNSVADGILIKREFASDVTIGENVVWAVTARAHYLARVNPSTNRVTGVLNLPKGGTAVAVAGGSVWVGTITDVLRLQPSS